MHTTRSEGFKKKHMAAALLSMLMSCSQDTAEPVGIGIGADEYKESPCACVELHNSPPDEPYLMRLRRQLSA